MTEPKIDLLHYILASSQVILTEPSPDLMSMLTLTLIKRKLMYKEIFSSSNGMGLYLRRMWSLLRKGKIP